MTLLTIAQGLAMNVGMNSPTQLFSAQGRELLEVIQLANETGQELSRRVQWGKLTKNAALAGSGPLPDDFDRLVDGVTVRANGQTVRPLTQAEWADLPVVTGSPRYFLLADDTITLWPEGAAAVVYQSDAWVIGGTDRFTADDQSPVFDEGLFLKFLVVRWRRLKGMPYQDEEAEAEAALQDYARQDDRGRA